jgi:hypothetical protein
MPLVRVSSKRSGWPARRDECHPERARDLRARLTVIPSDARDLHARMTVIPSDARDLHARMNKILGKLGGGSKS